MIHPIVSTIPPEVVNKTIDINPEIDTSLLLKYWQALCDLLYNIFHFSSSKASKNQIPKDSDSKYVLLLSSSGGAGHISAINAISKDIQDNLIYKPVTTTEQQNPLEMFVIMLCSFADTINVILKRTSLPELVNKDKLQRECDSLRGSIKKERKYFDVLLDMTLCGVLSAALWNTAQQIDATETLRKLINLQPAAEESLHPKN